MVKLRHKPGKLCGGLSKKLRKPGKKACSKIISDIILERDFCTQFSACRQKALRHLVHREVKRMTNYEVMFIIDPALEEAKRRKPR